MTAVRESREVVGTSVDLLQEGCLGVDQPSGPQYPVDLAHHPRWRDHVLQDRLDHHCIHRGVLQGDRVRIRDEQIEVASIEVETDDLYLSCRGVELLHAIAYAAATHDEDPCLSASQQIQQAADLTTGHVIVGLDDALQP